MAGNKVCYVVIGVTGEYSDRREWVAGYTDTEQQAKYLVCLYDALAREIQEWHTAWRYEDSHTDKLSDLHPDPRFVADAYYTCRYHYEEAHHIEGKQLNEHYQNLDRLRNGSTRHPTFERPCRPPADDTLAKKETRCESSEIDFRSAKEKAREARRSRSYVERKATDN